MELGPPRGRPEKDPEDRRSELVHFRACPSHKELIRQEANRRGTSLTLVVVHIGFEEMNPSGRPIPYPQVCRWLLSVAGDYRDVSKDSTNKFPRHELDSYAFYKRAREVRERRERRKTLWEDATDERRTETIGIRLKPRRLRWLEERADQKSTSRSALLRARTLQGIAERDHMTEVAQLLSSLREKSEALYEKSEEMPEDEVRREIFELAQDIEYSVEEVLGSA